MLVPILLEMRASLTLAASGLQHPNTQRLELLPSCAVL